MSGLLLYVRRIISLKWWIMGFASSNMINLHGPLSWIFIGFLLAIIGCVLMIQSPELSLFASVLFLVAGILVALAVTTLASE
jgi:fucose permease